MKAERKTHAATYSEPRCVQQEKSLDGSAGKAQPAASLLML